MPTWNGTSTRPERDGQHAFKAHDPFVIDHSSLWLERRLHALVSLIGFTGLADCTYSQLSGKLVGRAQFTIHQLLQGELIGGLLRKSESSHILTCCIELAHGVKQGLVLFGCRRKLQEHRLFHACMIACIEKSVSRRNGTQPIASQKEGLAYPMLESQGLPQARLVKEFLQVAQPC
jgi:hypothetical protein